MEGCTRGCCFVACFSVWQLRLDHSVECDGIHFRRVLFGMEGWQGRKMLCLMKGMTAVCWCRRVCSLWWLVGDCSRMDVYTTVESILIIKIPRRVSKDETALSGWKCSFSIFKIYIMLYFNVSSTVLWKNRNTKFLYIYITDEGLRPKRFYFLLNFLTF